MLRAQASAAPATGEVYSTQPVGCTSTQKLLNQTGNLSQQVASRNCRHGFHAKVSLVILLRSLKLVYTVYCFPKA